MYVYHNKVGTVWMDLPRQCLNTSLMSAEHHKSVTTAQQAQMMSMIMQLWRPVQTKKEAINIASTPPDSRTSSSHSILAPDVHHDNVIGESTDAHLIQHPHETFKAWNLPRAVVQSDMQCTVTKPILPWMSVSAKMVRCVSRPNTTLQTVILCMMPMLCKAFTVT